MLEMQPANLKHFKDIQLRYMEQRPLNILSRKLKQYQDQLNASGTKPRQLSGFLMLHITLVMKVILCK